MVAHLPVTISQALTGGKSHCNSWFNFVPALRVIVNLNNIAANDDPIVSSSEALMIIVIKSLLPPESSGNYQM